MHGAHSKRTENKFEVVERAAKLIHIKIRRSIFNEISRPVRTSNNKHIVIPSRTKAAPLPATASKFEIKPHIP